MPPFAIPWSIAAVIVALPVPPSRRVPYAWKSGASAWSFWKAPSSLISAVITSKTLLSWYSRGAKGSKVAVISPRTVMPSLALPMRTSPLSKVSFAGPIWAWMAGLNTNEPSTRAPPRKWYPSTQMSSKCSIATQGTSMSRAFGSTGGNLSSGERSGGSEKPGTGGSTDVSVVFRSSGLILLRR